MRYEATGRISRAKDFGESPYFLKGSMKKRQRSLCGRQRSQPQGCLMRSETIAVHGGYEDDPTTHAVAVPIYQTAAYTFDSAEHGAALFNLEAQGFRYSRINNPTVDVLEKRIAQLE